MCYSDELCSYTDDAENFILVFEDVLIKMHQ